jgi:hypothetical protein
MSYCARAWAMFSTAMRKSRLPRKARSISERSLASVKNRSHARSAAGTPCAALA